MLRIANPAVTAKIEALARKTELTKTAAVEEALDALPAEHHPANVGDVWEHFEAILVQIDRVPESISTFDPLEWGEHGLPL